MLHNVYHLNLTPQLPQNWQTSNVIALFWKNLFQLVVGGRIKTKGKRSLYLYLLEVSGRLDLPDRLHEGVPDNNADVSPRVALSFLAQSDEVCLRQAVGRGSQMQLEHERAGVLLGQRNVDSLFKPKTRTEDSISHYEVFNPLSPDCFPSNYGLNKVCDCEVKLTFS